MLNIILIDFNLFFSEHCFKARVGSSRRQTSQGSERTCPKSCYTPHCLPKLQRPGWVQSQPCQYSEIPHERQKVWWYWIQVSSSVSAQELCVNVWFCYQSLRVLLQCLVFLLLEMGLCSRVVAGAWWAHMQKTTTVTRWELPLWGISTVSTPYFVCIVRKSMFFRV